MPSKGPVTKDTEALAIGLMSIMVDAASGHISTSGRALNKADHSVGSLNNTTMTIDRETKNHESGFPLLKDKVVVLRESMQLQGEVEELTYRNLMTATGKNPNGITARSGEISIGALTAPQDLRVEGLYEFPDGDEMLVILPRAQVETGIEINFQKEDWGNVSVTFTAQRADSATTGGNAAWDSKPLGVIVFS